MLNKVKLLAIVGVILTILRFIFPDVPIPVGIDVSIVAVILFAASYFRSESASSLRNYGSR